MAAAKEWPFLNPQLCLRYCLLERRDPNKLSSSNIRKSGMLKILAAPESLLWLLPRVQADFEVTATQETLHWTTGQSALGDIAGKVTQQPLYNLLGGPCRSRVRVYANGWSYKLQSPEDYARAAEAVRKRGFTAMKLDPLPGPCYTDHAGP